MQMIMFSEKEAMKNCEKGPEGEELLEEKKSNGQKDGKEIEQKTMLKSLNKKLITVQNFSLMTIICENMA